MSARLADACGSNETAPHRVAWVRAKGAILVRAITRLSRFSLRTHDATSHPLASSSAVAPVRGVIHLTPQTSSAAALRVSAVVAFRPPNS